MNALKKPWLWLLVILALGLTIRLVTFRGYQISDAGAYTDLAFALANGELKIEGYPEAPSFPLRIGLYGPAASLIYAFGFSESVIVLYPFLLSLTSIPLSFLLARRLFNSRAGLIAAGIMAIVPLETSNATLLLPDLPAAFWAGVGVYLLIRSADEKNWESSVMAMISGLSFGISWLCKEGVFYLVPFVAGYLVYIGVTRKRLNTFVFVALGAGLILCAEGAFYSEIANDSLYRLHETERNYEESKRWFFYENSPRYGWAEGEDTLALARRLLYEGPERIILNRNFSLVVLVGLIGLAYAISFRIAGFAFPGWWLISLVVLFNFGSSSFEDYRPLVLMDRYLYPLLLPATIVSAGFLDRLFRGRRLTNDTSAFQERRFWGCVLVLIMLMATGRGLIHSFRTHVTHSSERQLATHLPGSALVVSDRRTAKALNYFRSKLSNCGNTREFEDVDLVKASFGSYIVFHHRNLEFLERFYGYQPPPSLSSPPPSWELIRETKDVRLFVVQDD